METPPPPTQPKKRGRPKGSTKAKAESEREAASAAGTIPRMRGAEKRNVPPDEKYTQWKSLVPVLYDWLANHNLVWPSLSCRYLFFFFFLN